MDSSVQITPAPGRVGQGTAVEQVRAAAQVHAAVMVARDAPRDIQAAIAEMRTSCTNNELASRAFYAYPKGKTTVTGASVHLARELARVWGNIEYGISELRRDDEFGQSEMLAFAWDLQKNSRTSHIFIVPHMRDKRGGGERLVELREIYENNTNNGARRLRQAIFAILPVWFVEEAKNLCARTLSDGGGVPLPRRIADAVAGFERLGVTADRIETQLGRPSAKWTEHDLAQLGITYNSIQRGELSADDAFPPPRLTEQDLTAPPAPAPHAGLPADDDWPPAARPGSGHVPEDTP